MEWRSATTLIQRHRRDARCLNPIAAPQAPLTSSTDGTTHAVLESELAANHSGAHRARCGQIVIPASLCEPPGKPCWACWPHGLHTDG